MPRRLWFAPAAVAALRALPWLAALHSRVTDAGVLLPIGYNTRDFLTYAALAREAIAGHLFVANPFTTTPQDGRFLLLFHDAIGWVAGATGMSVFTVLELAGVPLLAALLVVLWRLTREILDDPRDREMACWLVFLAGGFDGALLSLLPVPPEVSFDLSPLMGWSIFAAAYNPVWVASLVITLATLPPLLRAEGVRNRRDLLCVTAGIAGLAWTHSYSAFIPIGIAVGRPVIGALFGLPVGRTATAIVPGLLLVALMSAWQGADPVYRATSVRIFGPEALAVFWYPITLGLLAVLAVLGWRRWIAEQAPCRLGMATWTLLVIFLHTSPILSGYHFAYHLYVPICLAAASPFAHALEKTRTRPALRAALLLLLFHSPLVLTGRALWDLEKQRVPTATMDVVATAGALTPGNVLADASIGNILPAFSAHHVYVGHWFMTPGYYDRANEAARAVRGQLAASELRSLVERERIRYVACATPAVDSLVEMLGQRVLLHAAGDTMTVIEIPPLS